MDVEVQQRPDAGRRRALDLKCIWLSGNGVAVNAVIGKEPLQLGKWDKQLCCLEKGGGGPLHRWGGLLSTVGLQAGACQPGDLMICNICVNIFGASRPGGGGGGGGCLLLFTVKRWRGFAALASVDLGSRWSRTWPLHPNAPQEKEQKKCWTWVTG